MKNGTTYLGGSTCSSSSSTRKTSLNPSRIYFICPSSSETAKLPSSTTRRRRSRSSVRFRTNLTNNPTANYSTVSCLDACSPAGEEEYANGLRKQQMVLEFDVATWRVCPADIAYSFLRTHHAPPACNRGLQHYEAHGPQARCGQDKAWGQVVRLGALVPIRPASICTAISCLASSIL